MVGTMTEDELQAIEARTNAATSQPWEACKLSEGLGYVYSSGLGDVVAGSSSAAFLLDDAEFIAAARTDVPALVAEVRRLRRASESPIHRYDVVYGNGRNRRRATVDAYSAADAVFTRMTPGTVVRSVNPNPSGSLGDAPDPETE
jgi:hypothetical protein